MSVVNPMEKMEITCLLLILVFCSCCTLTSNAPQGTKNFPFPFPIPVPGLPPLDSATPFFTFDGIDYDELPGPMKHRHNDCHGHHIRCIQNRNYFHLVCSYNAPKFLMGQYYSHCEMELRACLSRQDSNKGIYGTKYYDDPFFFSGEGRHCVYSDIKDEVK